MEQRCWPKLGHSNRWISKTSAVWSFNKRISQVFVSYVCRQLSSFLPEGVALSLVFVVSIKVVTWHTIGHFNSIHSAYSPFWSRRYCNHGISSLLKPIGAIMLVNSHIALRQYIHYSWLLPEEPCCSVFQFGLTGLGLEITENFPRLPIIKEVQSHHKIALAN